MLRSHELFLEVISMKSSIQTRETSVPLLLCSVYCLAFQRKYSLRHRKCGVRGFILELFVSKTRTCEERASEGF